MRVSRMLTLATLGVSMAGCGLGFAPGPSYRGTGRRSATCAGEEVLDVFNPLLGNIDIYVVTGPGSAQFFTSAPGGQSTIPLAGTPYEHSYPGFLARVGNEPASDVRITRRCKQRSG